MRVLELFGCSGGMAEGLRRGGIAIEEAYDYDLDACVSYTKNLGHAPIRMDVRDLLRMVEGGWRPLGKIDLFVADPPCFPPGTMITTSRGRRAIESVRVGDVVLTHAGRWRPVLQTFSRPYAGRLLSLSPRYRPDPIVCTPEHPFFVRRKCDGGYEEPAWMPASEVTIGDAVLSPRASDLPLPRLTVRTRHGGRSGPYLVDVLSRIDLRDVRVAWLLGLYLAEGHRRGWAPTTLRKGLTRREVLFSIHPKEVPAVLDRLAEAGEHGIVGRTSTASRVTINSPDWWVVCGEFGDGAGHKLVPEWVFGLPLAWRQALLAGYVFGDGHAGPNSGGGTLVETTTVSEDLAWGIARLVESVEGVVSSLGRVKYRPAQIIEGRTVQCRQPFRVRWSPPVGRKRRGMVDSHGAWLPIRAIEENGPCEVVHNLEVEEDNSYVADGIAVHNCTPWSRAGKRKGQEDERDMIADTVTLVRMLRPTAFLIANVPGLDDGPNWHIVQKTIGSLADDGYCIDFQRLNASAYGVPQHRVRPFWFGHPMRASHITWPEPTHADPKTLRTGALPGVRELLPWVTCREALCHLSKKDLGTPVRLRWRGANGKQVASIPDKPARVVGTSGLSDGNVLAHPTEAVREGKRAHRHPGKKARASALDEPAHVPRSNGDGNTLTDASSLYEGPNHRPSRADAPARTLTKNTHGDGALLASEDMFSPSDPDVPSKTIRAAARGTQVLVVVPHHPVSDHDAPSRTVRAGNETSPDKLLTWPWDRPSTTIQKDDIPPPGHHDENWDGGTRSLPNAVKLSEKAAAILQGFPEGWLFAGDTKKARWAQIGMAMPPPLAHAVATSIATWFAKLDRVGRDAVKLLNGDSP